MFGNEEINTKGHVKISDMSVKGFEWLLRYLYTGIAMDEYKEDDQEEEGSFHQLLREIGYIADKV